MEKKFLTREQIINCNNLKSEDVAVPEFGEGCYVRVTELPAYERDEFENWILRNKDTRDYVNFRARLCAYTVVDPETGRKVFADERNNIKPEDIEELGKKSGAALDRICDIAQKLSGMKKEDVDKMTKNL